MKHSPEMQNPILRKVLGLTYAAVAVSMLVAFVWGIVSTNMEMILYALATIALLVVPSLIRKAGIRIPPLMELFCILFLFASVTLAKVLDFYTRIPSWDLILHFFSGPLITAIGIAFLGLWQFGGKGTKNLAPLFVALFGFLFSMTIAGLWEFYEFAFDTFFGTQMQKFELRGDVLDTGLLDTMTDMLVAALGSVCYAVFTWIDLKFWNGFVTDKIFLARK